MQGVVGNFVLKTDPLPVCLHGFYVTLCMEKLSALLFFGSLVWFLHTFTNLRKNISSTLIVQFHAVLIPTCISFDRTTKVNSGTLTDIHKKLSLHEMRESVC